MKFFPLLRIAAACCTVALAAQSPAPANADSAPAPATAAAVFCAQSEFDAGDQPAGSVISHSYTVRNPLQQTAALKLTHPAGLSVTGLPATLAAGESAAVTLTTEPLGGMGEFSYIADLVSGPTPGIVCTLEVHGRVLQYFRTDPPDQLLLLTLAPGHTLNRKVTLARKDGLPFTVSGVRWEEVRSAPLPADAGKRQTAGGETADQGLAGKFFFTAESGSARIATGWSGGVAAGPLAHPGLYFARLRIATDHPRQPEVVVDVIIRNLSPLVIFPGEVHFFNPVNRGDLAAGKAPLRRLFVHALPGEPRFVPGEVRVAPEFLNARWTADTAPRKDEAVLEISLKPNAPPGAFHGEIRIARSAAADDEERVAVEGVIQP